MKFKDLKVDPFSLGFVSVVLVLIFSQLIQDGMFMDGLLYVCVSHNLSEGLGSFWEPNYSKTTMEVFREQPPLYFGLLAIFYKIFGSSLYVERLFGAVCLVIEFIIIRSTWLSVIKRNETKKLIWLPVLFFTIIPVVFWSYANLVEETVMVIFASMAVLFARYATLSHQKLNQFVWVLIAAFAIVLSTLTKGIQGSFPLVAVLVFWFFEREISLKRAILLSIVLFIFFIMIYLLMFFIDDEIYLSLILYLENRLTKAFITGVHDTTDSHFYLFFRLLSELIPIFVLLVFIVILVFKIHGQFKVKSNYQKSALSFIFIGLSGTLPLMVTKEQRGFYMLTALPFFAIALALLIFPYLSLLINNWNEKSKSFSIFKITSIFLLLTSTTFTVLKFNKYKRDKELLEDIYLFLPLLPQGSIVGLNEDLFQNWNLKNYLIRYKYISSENADNGSKYLILSKTYYNKQFDNSYQKTKLKTNILNLYIKKD